MIEHLVLFQVHHGWQTELRDGLATFAVAIRPAVPGISEVAVGSNTNPGSAERYSHAMVVRLDTHSSWEDYQAHPLHEELVGKLSSWCQERFAVTFEHPGLT